MHQPEEVAERDQESTEQQGSTKRLGSTRAIAAAVAWAVVGGVAFASDAKHGGWLAYVVLDVAPLVLCLLPQARTQWIRAVDAEHQVWAEPGGGTPLLFERRIPTQRRLSADRISVAFGVH